VTLAELVTVQLLNNLPQSVLSSIGTGSDLTGPRRRVLNAPSPASAQPQTPVTAGPYNGTLASGGILLTDQQSVSLRFTTPCAGSSCYFTLTRLSIPLRSLPAYFLPPDAAATVSFKVELGRYYTNLPPVRRQLTGASASPNYAPFVDFQTSVFTEAVTVPATSTLFTLSLLGLHYRLHDDVAGVTSGDMKVVITPYIHYDRSRASAGSAEVAATPEQIEWMLSEPAEQSLPVSGFVNATGFDAPPACLSTGNGVLVTASASRLLTGVTSFFPPGCTASSDWRCTGLFPGLWLEAQIPAPLTYVGSPVVSAFLPAAPASPTLPLPDCPATGVPLSGSPADNTVLGRYLADSDVSAQIPLTTPAGAGSGLDILLVFPAPCTRCSLSLRNAWLPLAKGAGCPASINIRASVGLWAGGPTGPLQQPAAAWPSMATAGVSGVDGEADVFQWADFVLASGPNGASTKVALSDTPAFLQLLLGAGSSPATVAVPGPRGSHPLMALRLQADSCLRVSFGLNATIHNAQCPGLPPTPVAVLQHTLVAAGSVQAWQPVCLDAACLSSPGIYLPAVSALCLPECTDRSLTPVSYWSAGAPAPYGIGAEGAWAGGAGAGGAGAGGSTGSGGGGGSGGDSGGGAGVGGDTAPSATPTRSPGSGWHGNPSPSSAYVPGIGWSPSSSSVHLSSASIAGIVVGSVAGVALVGLAVAGVIILRRRRGNPAPAVRGHAAVTGGNTGAAGSAQLASSNGATRSEPVPSASATDAPAQVVPASSAPLGLPVAQAQPAAAQPGISPAGVGVDATAASDATTAPPLANAPSADPSQIAAEPVSAAVTVTSPLPQPHPAILSP
jgi:hypothetical protein